jgi:hypothetical protein
MFSIHACALLTTPCSPFGHVKHPMSSAAWTASLVRTSKGHNSHLQSLVQPQLLCLQLQWAYWACSCGLHWAQLN